MDILRFITAGNVDDGKSTLIGRLLYDTHNIKSDVLESVSGNDAVNLAHITDGLRSEREQGITIDVAYKYFTTKTRKYIITDAPGHFKYTRNLVTGASGVDLMIVLVDARNGITEQTRRHALVASFLKVKHIVIAINKMDAVDFDEEVFIKIQNEFLSIATILGLHNLTFIPISALLGDNVSFRSQNMEWYKKETLMQYIENCTSFAQHSPIARFTIQCEIDSDKPGFEKGYAGKLLSGTLALGDVVGIYPGGITARVKDIQHGYDRATTATVGQNITLYLDKDVEAKRGDIIAHPDAAPHCSTQFGADLCWLNELEPLNTGSDYLLRINGMETKGRITEVFYKTDITTFEQYNDEHAITVNQFARVKMETKEVVCFDLFSLIPENGRGIIIDPKTNYTSGAFTIN